MSIKNEDVVNDGESKDKLVGIKSHTYITQHSSMFGTAAFIAFFAWISIGISTLIAVLMLLDLGPLAALPAFASVIGGLVLLAFSRMTKALGIIADQTRESMNLIKALADKVDSQ